MLPEQEFHPEYQLLNRGNPLKSMNPKTQKQFAHLMWQQFKREWRMPPMTRILVADDSDVVRRGIKRLLDEHTSWEVCGEAGDGQEAVEKAC
jgi:PleD family two-component response regulator